MPIRQISADGGTDSPREDTPWRAIPLKDTYLRSELGKVEPETAVDKVLDLFLELGADDDQCDFPYLFGSGLGGFAMTEVKSENDNMKPLFEAIIRQVPPPVGDHSGFKKSRRVNRNDDRISRIVCP